MPLESAVPLPVEDVLIGVVDRVASTPGVAAAAPVIQAVAMAGRPGQPEEFVVALGADCRIGAMVGALLVHWEISGVTVRAQRL